MKDKKFKLIVWGIVILLFSFIGGNILFNKFYKIKYKSMDTVDKEMFDDLSNIYKEFENNKNDIWNGFNFEKEPLIVIRTFNDKGIIRKYSYAINVDGIDNSIFAKKINMPESIKLPEVYRLSSLYPNLITTMLPDNFGTIEIDKINTIYFKYYSEMITNPKSNHDFSSFLLHESFHICKQKEWTYDKDNDGSIVLDFPNNKENYALMGIEFLLLDKCLETDNKDDIEKYLKDLITIRTYRYDKWPQLKTISNIEAIEGTATYLPEKINSLMNGELINNNEEKIKYSDALKYLSNLNKISMITFEKSIYYNTGSSLGFIMDELGIDWKYNIEDSKDKDGETQYEILKSYFNIDNKDISSENIKNIEIENNYDELLKQGEKIAEIVKQSQ